MGKLKDLDKKTKEDLKRRLMESLIVQLNKSVHDLSQAEVVKTQLSYEDFLDVFAGGIGGLLDYLIYGYKKIPGVGQYKIRERVAQIMVGLNQIAHSVLKEKIESLSTNTKQKKGGKGKMVDISENQKIDTPATAPAEDPAEAPTEAPKVEEPVDSAEKTPEVSTESEK